MENINWYPGHMKKTRELIKENLKLVDGVVEVIDARIPRSSRNPIIDELVGAKPRIVVLNKADLADSKATFRWCDELAKFRDGAKSGADAKAGDASGAKASAATVEAVLPMNCMKGEGVKKLFAILEKMNEEKNAGKDMKRPYRLMIVGVPNVGKSSLINRMTGKKSTQTGDRPGVTKGKQWLRLSNGMQLLDTPGILWPKFEDPNVGMNLAFCGSIKDEIMDIPTLGMELIGFLGRQYPDLLQERYKLAEIAETPLENMEAMAQNRGCILPGKRIDYERIGRLVLDEFRSGKIGQITLEMP